MLGCNTLAQMVLVGLLVDVSSAGMSNRALRMQHREADQQPVHSGNDDYSGSVTILHPDSTQVRILLGQILSLPAHCV